MRRFLCRTMFSLLFLLVSFLILAQEPDIYTEEEGISYLFYADNPAAVEVWIALQFSSLINFHASEPLPYARLLQPNEERVFLFSLTQTDTSRTSSYQFSLASTIGNPHTADHDDDHRYYFPFQHGEKFKLSQGYHGAFSHSEENAYAVDFVMDEGTEIYAARSGLVVSIKEDSRIGGPTLRYGGYENYIFILHEDGSIGSYVHLRYGGALVEVGETVDAGQLIGYSGNTGLSTGPHLHFSVNIPQLNGTMQSIPFFFLSYDGSSLSPQEGHYYYGFHSGKEAFPVRFGADLRTEDFEDHHLVIEETGKVEIVTDIVDDTTIVFIQNGTPVTQTVILSAQLQRMQSSRSLPLTLNIPPLSEAFFTLLRSTPGAYFSSYQLRVSYSKARE